MRFLKRFPTLGIATLVAPILILTACGAGGGGPRPPAHATNITLDQEFLSFDGSSAGSLTVTANGPWTLSSDSSWLKASPASGGSGTTTVSLSIDRNGVAPAHYAGKLTFSGATPLKSVTVNMRFPRVTGQVIETGGRLTAGSVSPELRSASEASAVASEVIPGEYLVRLNDSMARVLEFGASGVVPQDTDVTLGSLQAMSASVASDHGLAVASPVASSVLPVMVVRASDAAAVSRLMGDGRVSVVEPNLRLSAPPLDPAAITVTYDFGVQWHYDHINLSDAWNVTQGEDRVVVAVIDSGFATLHPNLQPNLVPGYDFAFNDADPSANTLACVEHGTHVAGTIAATWNEEFNIIGAAPGVKVRPVRVGIEDGSGCPMPLSAVISAVLYSSGYALEGVPQVPPADVINMSLGGNSYSAIFEEAITFAQLAGSSVVAAAGNDGVNAVMYPAAYAGVIGVSATNPNSELAVYSNYGDEIDVTAPGGDVRFDLDGDGFVDGVLSLAWDVFNNHPYFQFLQGTSMAAPHVSAVAALMKSVNPDLDPASVTFLLRSSARDIGIPGPDTFYGWGMVDAAAAVELAREVSNARFSEVIVRLRSGSTVVATANAIASGSFDLGLVAAGTYTLEAGTDRDGDGRINDVGEFYVSTSVTVSYSGDINRALTLELR